MNPWWYHIKNKPKFSYTIYPIISWIAHVLWLIYMIFFTVYTFDTNLMLGIKNILKTCVQQGKNVQSSKTNAIKMTLLLNQLKFLLILVQSQWYFKGLNNTSVSLTFKQSDASSFKLLYYCKHTFHSFFPGANLLWITVEIKLSVPIIDISKTSLINGLPVFWLCKCKHFLAINISLCSGGNKLQNVFGILIGKKEHKNSTKTDKHLSKMKYFFILQRQLCGALCVFLFNEIGGV